MFFRNFYTVYQNTRRRIRIGRNRRPVVTAVTISNFRHTGTLNHICWMFFNCYHSEPSFIETGPTVAKLLRDGATAWLHAQNYSQMLPLCYWFTERHVLWMYVLVKDSTLGCIHLLDTVWAAPLYSPGAQSPNKEGDWRYVPRGYTPLITYICPPFRLTIVYVRTPILPN
jgi:hypothetical protein